MSVRTISFSFHFFFRAIVSSLSICLIDLCKSDKEECYISYSVAINKLFFRSVNSCLKYFDCPILAVSRYPGGQCFGVWVFSLSLGSWSLELMLDLVHFNGWETRFRYEKLNTRILFFWIPRERRFGGKMKRLRCVLLILVVVEDLVGKHKV